MDAKELFDWAKDNLRIREEDGPGREYVGGGHYRDVSLLLEARDPNTGAWVRLGQPVDRRVDFAP